ncbi:hypothetical protein HOR40_gp07 [Pectobacterium phage PP74]|uniref:Uncharacterized protein n=1 Tax=Pectobacterium phage PP74 TaxID=1916101 RepID=A0A1J0MF43_9CAUD|nr:hypothetical protein HOR40_gp07 [Pectobacterium phage PP74]APD19665.1 hypothetical protein PP74_07 [Pectobacterium phage PP74]
MITFIAIITTIVSLTLLARFAYRIAHLNESLHSEMSLRKGCQVQLASNDKSLRALQDRLHRTEWSFDQDRKHQDECAKNVIDGLRETIKGQREHIKTLTKFRDDILFSGITSIKFTAHIPDAGWKRTEFKLGLGSCGKDVQALAWVEQDDRYLLTQTCTDGERKEFTYYKKDVAGRIEITYKVTDNTTHY